MPNHIHTTHGGRGFRALCASLALTALLLLTASSALAVEPPNELFRLGDVAGSAAGELRGPRGTAMDPDTGQIYVGGGNGRVDEFSPWGAFIKAFGWNVAPGAVNELQEVRLRAAAGTFKLGFEGAATPDLPFDASADDVRSALDGLSTIGGAGGEVTVTEHPGSTSTETPSIWTITFMGSLGATDVAQVETEEGTTPLSGGAPTTGIEARTLADGVAAGHVGLEACTAESGCQRGIEGTRPGQLGPGASLVVGPSGDVFVWNSFDNFETFEHNTSIQEFDPAGRFVRSLGGDTIADGAVGTGVLTPGSTKITSVTTTEKVFLVGQPIEGIGIEAGTTIEAVGVGRITLSSPATAAATETPTSVSSPEGANNVASNETQTIALSPNVTGGAFALAFTTPNPSPSEAGTGAGGIGSVQPGSSVITEVTTSWGSFEVGDPISLESRAGEPTLSKGTRITAVEPGQITISQPAPDSAENLRLTTATVPWNASAVELQAALLELSNIEPGDIEVTGPTGGPWKVEFKGRYGNSNVEALAPRGAGQTLTTSSGEARVTVTSENAGEVCEIAAECQGGAEGTAQGQLAESPSLAISPAGELLVADSHRAGLAFDSRVQSFSTEGVFETEVLVPGKQIQGLAAAPGGDKLYAIYKGAELDRGRTSRPEDIHLLDPASGAEVGTWKLDNPQYIATDSAGNLWAVVGEAPEGHAARIEHVAEFDADGSQLLPNQVEEESCIVPEEEGHGSCQFFAGARPSVEQHLGLGGGLAGGVLVPTSSRDRNDAYLTVYGPPPVQFESPPSVPPAIETQYALSVDTTGAEVGARINPRFWADTTYYLEYGTHPCSEGGCAAKPAAPGLLLSESVASTALPAAPIVLEGLQPGTTYHYRFVAQSTGGGPVLGRGGTEAEAGEEATFTTAGEAGIGTGCGNEAFRTGASAALPDCRAYEMVTPVDKEGADVLAVSGETFSQPLQQASTSGERLVFPSRGSFGDDPTAPYTSQYLSARGPSGWSTHSLNSPQGDYVPNAGTFRLNPEFPAFSPDLCHAWYQSNSDPPLAAGAPAGYRDLYRRTDQECGGLAYEPINTQVPSSWPPYEFGFQMGFEGASSAETETFFIVKEKLAPEGAPGGPQGAVQLYVRAQADPQPRLVCVLPNGKPWQKVCSAGDNISDEIAGPQGSFSNGKVLGFFQGAVSEDGSKVYWSAGAGDENGGGGGAEIYLRENPTQPQSAVAHGGASGTGRLTVGSETVTTLVAARGKAQLVEGSPRITLEQTSIGEFVTGQKVTGPGIPAGTTVDSVEGATVTLSQAIEAGKSGKGVTVSSAGPMPFEVGQSISARGIPDGTTITAVAEGALTLSSKATVTKAGVQLVAIGECTEATMACTIPVSQKAEQESGVEHSFFRAAAADGSRAIFLNGGGLYEFRLAGQSTHEIAAEALGVMGTSKDARRVYFASEEALTPEAVAGEPNLYLYDSSADSYALVAVLASRDINAKGYSPILGYVPGEGGLKHLERVSADGLHAAFLSFGQPTGYDNTDLSTGQEDSEVYLYSAAADGGAGKLVCASCNPSGARPRGHQEEEEGTSIPWAGRIPGFESSFYGTRLLSEDGQRLFFESYDALLPRDTNGAEDVYEWEASGSGSCSEASSAYSSRNGGCIYLISTGKSPTDSQFLDADPSGVDAFFTTEESLLQGDTGLRDVYDARIEGGFPPPEGSPPACEGEGCQPVTSAPNDPTPASAGLRGAGNVAPAAKPRCGKGKRQVRKNGATRCVKRKKAVHHKKAHHSKKAHHPKKSHQPRSAKRDRGGRR